MRFLLFLILCPILLLASDNAMASGQNYIVRRDYLKAAGTEYVDVVEYFDGLGRSVETVQRGITPSGQSLVTVREYDSQSRLAREWQPVVSPNTDFKFDRGGEITYRNDGEGRRMEVTHRISSASASLAGKPVPSAAYKTVLKRKYIDHFVYRNDTLEYILTPTGYIDRDGNYYHYQKDSRGSVRTVLDGAGRVVERNDYYPYGMLMDGVSKSVQPYKFGGKELDRIGGINHYDFHARQLQLPIPHFYQQDPYADKYPHLSPYLYCAANPLRYIDPSGKWIVGTDGKRIYYSVERGFSKNASSDVVEIGNAMLLAETGKKILNNMLNTDYPIYLSFGFTEKGNAGRTTTNVSFKKYKNGGFNKQVTDVSIILNMLGIKELNDDKNPRHKGMGIKYRIGAVATHEGTHATDMRANSTYQRIKKKSPEIEKYAEQNENKYLDEIIQQQRQEYEKNTQYHISDDMLVPRVSGLFPF